MNKFWLGAAWLFTITLGVFVKTIVPENCVYITGFIFGTISMGILTISRNN